MDRPSALNILGLQADATRTEAKKAYRQLAKTCHPDRFSGRPGAAEAEIRMKELNAAFSFLVKVLPDREPPGDTAAGPKEAAGAEKKARPRTTGVFASFAKGLRTMAGPKKKRSSSARPAGNTRVSPVRRAGISKPVPPRAHRKKAPLRSAVSFEHILRENRSGKGRPAETSGLRSAAPAGDPYSRYVKLKQQQRMQRSRSRRGTVSRVEKITPVRPVSKVGGE